MHVIQSESHLIMHSDVYPERVARLPILACGFVLLAMSTSISFASAAPVNEVSTVCSSKQASKTVVVESQNSPTIPPDSQTQYRYSPSTPFTADAYPSVSLCARSFAARIAHGIRESNQFSPQTKFSIELATKIHTTDGTYWQPTKTFITDFRSELEGHFPANTFVNANQVTQKAEVVANNPELKTLNVYFSHTASRQAATADQSPGINETDPSGTIQANWAIGDTDPSKVTISYVTKPWVATDRDWSYNHSKSFGFYQGKDYRSKVVGFTSRLAGSPQEASSLAMQNAAHFHSLHYGARFAADELRFKVVDRFQQKLWTSSGEFWQEAVLVSVNIEKNASRIPVSPAPANPANLLLMLLAGAFCVTWIFSVVFKVVF